MASNSTLQALPDVRNSLRRGLPVLALGIRVSRSPDIARWASLAGYQALWVDLEHSGISLDATGHICSTALDLGLVPWVRVPEEDFGAIGRVLDAGALGIIAPRVESVEQAKRYLLACRFAPQGQRSQIATLVQTGFKKIPVAQMNQHLNNAMTVQILIESAAGVANADAIAALPGVDIVGVGANDLCADLGHPGNPAHPDVLAACHAVIAAALAHGKLAVVGGLADLQALSELYAAGAAPYLFAGIDTDLFIHSLQGKAQQTLEAYQAVSSKELSHE
ncbi:aldolase/citrate lyase family protein [Pseudomonas sp. 1912-s]|uniref:HpcH/HpaI aldolase family protein n=1 Tax=Pseudomonas sp. 1912-s TaxID=3033802 RepID=UPI0023DF3A92|nr:aldolase/citrate lyase family protein [Pseudomonas sp. 1912-s]MDF3201811.1 aldolase/citrate lyase family protein [Pseudomonas sp. 1912-s]